MSRIYKAFENKKAFIAFLTGGDPTIEKCEEYIMEMVRAGADLIEIGIPFSDPIAEGSVIQAANIRALSAGTTTDSIFSLVESIRQKTDIPLVFLTYVNPIFKFGYDAFFSRCESAGVDGVVIPDLPYEEKGELHSRAKDHNIDIISLIAPTSKERIRNIASEAEGFIYIVSSMGVTGVRNEIKTDLSAILKEVKAVSNVPAAVGFGINTPKQAEKIAKIADGVIVGSAIVKIIGKYKDNAAEHVYQYVKQMCEATKN